MKGKTLLAAALAALIASGAASAQKGPKLYRWVDKQGKVHYDQELPPEAVNEARREFSAATGNRAGEVERQLTPEERAANEAAAKAADAEAVRVEELRRQEDVMMSTYASESEMRRAYGERIALLKTTLYSIDVSIRNVRENLATMLQQASDAELGGRKVTEERNAAIRELHAEALRQQQFQANRRIEMEALNAEFARVLQRYRELKNASLVPPPVGAPAPLPNASPAPGGTH